MLTLCAVINNKIFCVHGGLSPNIFSINEVKFLNYIIF
jgi:diadenosine tetraphosphatase ApaH/serine/threonine PP2A family protein phosphatase